LISLNIRSAAKAIRPGPRDLWVMGFVDIVSG
jgi:hypothetical protein